jgi:hypothetical protein
MKESKQINNITASNTHQTPSIVFGSFQNRFPIFIYSKWKKHVPNSATRSGAVTINGKPML